ncbi:MAG: hypothetical protein E7184_03320 [Erysipelotrichaceae bacterium]|nr:hypothetical protein [Erysipelotrichaceae bacterium]
MYLKSRIFKITTFLLTLAVVIGIGYVIYTNWDAIKFKTRKTIDSNTKNSYIKINDGARNTNSLDVEVRVSTDNIKANYISYQTCFDPLEGKIVCNDWTNHLDTPFINYMGKDINSDAAWKKTIRLYDGLPDEQLQGRHIVKVKYFYVEQIFAGSSGSIEVLETRSNYIYYDSIAPKITTNSTNAWTDNNYLEVKYDDKSTVDYIASGVKSIKYKLCLDFETVTGTTTCTEEAPEVKVKKSLNGKFKINLELPKTFVTITVKDKAGNETIFSQVLRKDDTNPVVTINQVKDPETGKLYSINVSATDTNSMLNTLKYTFSNSDIRPNEAEFTNELFEYDNVSIDLPTKNKTYYLWVRAEDYAGNVTYKNSGPLYICDSVESCAKLTNDKKDYMTLLYASIGVAIIATVSIFVILSSNKKKKHIK